MINKKDLETGMVIETNDNDEVYFLVLKLLNDNIIFYNIKMGGSVSFVSFPMDRIKRIYKSNKITTYSHNLVNTVCQKANIIWEQKTKKKLTVAEIEEKLGYSIEVISES